jgi:hypothetical protein
MTASTSAPTRRSAVSLGTGLKTGAVAGVLAAVAKRRDLCDRPRPARRERRLRPAHPRPHRSVDGRSSAPSSVPSASATPVR